MILIFLVPLEKPNIQATGSNLNLICLNDDDPTSEGFELSIDSNTYSCDGVAP